MKVGIEANLCPMMQQSKPNQVAGSKYFGTNILSCQPAHACGLQQLKTVGPKLRLLQA